MGLNSFDDQAVFAAVDGRLRFASHGLNEGQNKTLLDSCYQTFVQWSILSTPLRSIANATYFGAWRLQLRNPFVANVHKLLVR